MADASYQIPPPVLDAYKHLDRYSRGARYAFMQFSEAQVEGLLANELEVISRFVGISL
jgi:hypothetical protein